MAAGARKGAKAGSVVAELGAGTGAVTKSLVKLGDDIENFKLYSIEFDAALAEILRGNYPHVNVVNDSAENLGKILGEDAKNLSAVVSSLPLLSLPDCVVGSILSEVERILPSGAVFVQFTYNLFRKPQDLGFSKLRHMGRSFVFLNVPPARVDVFIKP